jgi:hypothetical protein
MSGTNIDVRYLHFASCTSCLRIHLQLYSNTSSVQRKHWSEGHRLECVQDNSPSKTSAPGAIDQRNVNGHGKEELSGKDGPALLPSPIFRRDKESRDGGERLPSPKLSRSAVSDWANGGIEKKYHSGDVAEGGHKMGAARSSLSLPPSERQHLTYQELDAIFRTLDHKHNGYITHSELIAGLRKRPWAAQKMGMPDHVSYFSIYLHWLGSVLSALLPVQVPPALECFGSPPNLETCECTMAAFLRQWS